MIASSRFNHFSKSLKWGEDTLAIVIFTTMVILPFTEFTARIFGILSIPASQVLVQHLTLWIGFLGAVLATRQNKLLALTQRPLFSTEAKFHFGRYLAKLITFLVLISLAWGSWELVKVEIEYPMDIAPNIPRWVAMLIMPIGFALMSSAGL